MNNLAYGFDLRSPYMVEIKFLEVHPDIVRFLEQRGEYKSPNGVKISLGQQFRLGDPDGITGYPKTINIVRPGQSYESRSHTKSFSNTEYRDRYNQGMRVAFASLIQAATQQSSPYLVIL